MYSLPPEIPAAARRSMRADVITTDELLRCILLGLADLKRKLELAREEARHAPPTATAPGTSRERVTTPGHRRAAEEPCYWYYAPDADLAAQRCA